MLKKIQHIVIGLLLLCTAPCMAQIAMPDTVCVGRARKYKVNDAATPSNYTWRVNGVLQSSTKNDVNITWNTAGTYLLTVQEFSNNGCPGDERSGYVYVLPPPVANAGPDAVVCFGTTAQLNASGGSTYLWSPSTYLSSATVPNPRVNAPNAGVYRYVLDVTDAFGCRALKKDTVQLTILPPVKVFAGNDTAIALNQQLQLNTVDVNNSGFISYLWSPSFALNSSTIKNPVALFNNLIANNGITYRVTARTTEGCTATDDINVKVFVKADMYVPNAFTPNGDGLNDVLRPTLVGIKELKHFRVFNRYGELVFNTSKPGEGWNGIYKGDAQNAGGFTWAAEAVDYMGNIIIKKGAAVLIR